MKRIVAETGGVILVPYRPEHVATYHGWMLSEELREQTCSEPLTLAEVAANQQSWATADDKYTFIVLDRDFPDTPGTGSYGGGMAGDVNLFLNDADGTGLAEVDVMIAESRSRRKGIGRAAVSGLMALAATHLPAVKGFRVRINDDNAPSLSLFRALGFQQTSHSAVFQQTTLDRFLDAAFRAELESLAMTQRVAD